MSTKNRAKIGADQQNDRLINDDGIELVVPIDGQSNSDNQSAELCYTTVPFEVLEAVGVDVDDLSSMTDEQMQSVISLAAPSNSKGLHGVSYTSSEPSTSAPPESPPAQAPPPATMPTTAQSGNSDRLTLYILNDGSLKLSDTAHNRDYFFSVRQLAANDIDVDDLTDESLQKIIQMAMDSNNFLGSKRRKLEPTNSLANSFKYVAPSTSSFIGLPNSTNSRNYLNEHHTVGPAQYDLIGTEIAVKRNGKMTLATIRYCRQGGAYKVQFADGRFEWLGEDEIQWTNSAQHRGRNDHESYSETNDAYSPRASGSSFRSTQNARQTSTHLPGIKVTPSNASNQTEEPNFCCSVCDRKVHQNDVRYIVIRVPACDECSEKKIIVLDEKVVERTSVRLDSVEAASDASLASSHQSLSRSTNTSPDSDRIPATQPVHAAGHTS